MPPSTGGERPVIVARNAVNDPLAQTVPQLPDHSLSLMGVRAPLTPSAASIDHDNGLAHALGGVEGLLAQELEKKKDDWITEGKVAFQTGVTEEAMQAQGNRFTAQGYHSLQARDTVNKWFTEQTIELEQNGKLQEPQAFQKNIAAQRAEILKGITDPAARKVAVAAFEDMSPRLSASQAVKNSEYNRQQRTSSLATALYSTGQTSVTASRSKPGQQLSLSETPVEAVMQPSSRDRDIGIRTMLGEAANEGAHGLAAVAHVMRNRAVDGRWPDSIAGVALQPQQFSAWNSGAGGNNLVREYKPGDPIYDRAGEVFDAVMSGRHVDPTGGATHYYSPAGMKKLVADGDQTNEVPRWLESELGRNGSAKVKIGGHIFVGRTSGAQAVRSSFEPETATTLAAGTIGDLNTVPMQEGVAATGVTAVRAGNEVQQFLFGYKGLNDSDKASAATDAMRRGLEAGDDTLFRDLGGIATLQRLGAKPSEIDELLKSKERFDKKKENEFSVGNSQFRNDILARAEKGEAIDTILSDIDKRHKQGLLDDANARSLANTASDKVRAEAKHGHSQMQNPDMLNEISGVYQQAATGASLESVVKQSKAIAAKYGASEDDVKAIVGHVFSQNQQYLAGLRAEAKAAAKTAAEQAGTKYEIERSIANGYGLATVNGSIKTVNDHGLPITVPAKDYGIAVIKDKWAKPYQDAVKTGKMDAATASQAVVRGVTLELQKQGVVDEQTTAQLHAGLSGNILTKEGTLKPEAKQAYSTYLSLRTMQGIDPGYLSKVVGNDQTRTLLEKAFLLDSGTLNKDEALIKAHEILNDPTRTPEDAIKKDPVWRAKLNTDLDKALLERTNPGFFARMFGTYDRSEQQRILANNGEAKRYVTDRAEAYHWQDPHTSSDVHMEMALQDLQAHAAPVMGNLIIAKPGKELHTAMGVSDFGPTASEDAVRAFIRPRAEKLWHDPTKSLVGGTIYKDQENSRLGNAIRSTFDRGFLQPGTDAAPLDPPLKITYNAEAGTMTFDLYKDYSKQQTLGKPQTFFVKDIGDAYRKQQTTPTTWSETWKSLFGTTNRSIKSAIDAGTPASAGY